MKGTPWAPKLILLTLVLLGQLNYSVEGQTEKNPAMTTLAEINKKFYALTGSNDNIEPLRIAGVSEIVAVTTGTIPMALARRAGQLQLLRLKNGKWNTQNLPNKNLGNELSLLADNDSIVLRDSSRIFVYNKGTWKEIQQHMDAAVTEAFGRSKRSHWQLKSPYLYRGLDGREWAGGLCALDLNTGNWTRVPCSQVPVTDLKTDPSGIIWMTQSSVEAITAESLISKVTGPASVQVIASVSGVRGNKPPSRAVNAINWNYNPTGFCSVSFDSTGTPYLLAASVGILKNSGGGWSLVSKDWTKLPAFEPKSLTILPSGKKAIVTGSSFEMHQLDIQ